MQIKLSVTSKLDGACWNQSVPVIGYVAHGKSMAKVIKLKVAA